MKRLVSVILCILLLCPLATFAADAGDSLITSVTVNGKTPYMTGYDAFDSFKPTLPAGQHCTMYSYRFEYTEISRRPHLVSNGTDFDRTKWNLWAPKPSAYNSFDLQVYVSPTYYYVQYRLRVIIDADEGYSFDTENLSVSSIDLTHAIVESRTANRIEVCYYFGAPYKPSEGYTSKYGTPNDVTFAATGYDTGTVTGVTDGMRLAYGRITEFGAMNNFTSWIDVKDSADGVFSFSFPDWRYEIASSHHSYGEGHLLVCVPKNGSVAASDAAIVDMSFQTIEDTDVMTFDTVPGLDLGMIVNNSDRLIHAAEYRLSGTSEWIPAGELGSKKGINFIPAGTYDFRQGAHSYFTASEYVTVEVKQNDAYAGAIYEPNGADASPVPKQYTNGKINFEESLFPAPYGTTFLGWELDGTTYYPSDRLEYAGKVAHVKAIWGRSIKDLNIAVTLPDTSTASNDLVYDIKGVGYTHPDFDASILIDAGEGGDLDEQLRMMQGLVYSVYGVDLESYYKGMWFEKGETYYNPAKEFTEGKTYVSMLFLKADDGFFFADEEKLVMRPAEGLIISLNVNKTHTSVSVTLTYTPGVEVPPVNVIEGTADSDPANDSPITVSLRREDSSEPSDEYITNAPDGAFWIGPVHDGDYVLRFTKKGHYPLEKSFSVESNDVTVNVGLVPFGDANNDSRVNSKDVSVMLKYTAGWTVTPDLKAANVNGDDSVNAKDVSVILKYIAGWTVELLGNP